MRLYCTIIPIFNYLDRLRKISEHVLQFFKKKITGLPESLENHSTKLHILPKLSKIEMFWQYCC
jgi:hypothetical protein